MRTIRAFVDFWSLTVFLAAVLVIMGAV